MEIMWIVLALIIGTTLSMAMKSSGKKNSVGPFVLREFTYQGSTTLVLEKCKNQSFSGVLSIPEDVTVIGASAFCHFELITSVQFNKVLNTIGISSFEGCYSLSMVIIPNSVNHINSRAFKGCKHLKEVYIGDNIKKIEAFAFDNCYQLEKIHMTCFVPPILHDTGFDDYTKKNATLIIPKGSRDGYSKAPSWNRFEKIEEG